MCSIVAISKIIFSSQHKLQNIKNFPKLYINYNHHFHNFIDIQYSRIVAEIDAFADFYIDKLNILYHDYITTDDIIFYINNYCKKYT